jgi:hypothetical protein
MTLQDIRQSLIAVDQSYIEHRITDAAYVSEVHRLIEQLKHSTEVTQ